MTNSKALFNELKKRIAIAEGPSDLDSMLYFYFEKKFRLFKTDILSGKEIDVSLDLDQLVVRINTHEPIQYIVGETDFYGRDFTVDRRVLIPRPETELLVEEVVNHSKAISSEGIILDIGTGSGCIAISLAKELPIKKIIGLDVSDDALDVARLNAKRNSAEVNFIHYDILKDTLSIKNVECIVSNPPYVTENEITTMSKNVVDHEPPVALFVSNHNPLIFYKRILETAKTALCVGGKVFVEINERFGKEVSNIFADNNFKDIMIKKDFDGKDRIVVGTLKYLNN